MADAMTVLHDVLCITCCLSLDISLNSMLS